MRGSLRAWGIAAVRRVTRFPFLYILLIGGFAAAAAGLFGASYGLHNLFIEDGSAAYGADFFRNRPSFLTQSCISFAILFAWAAPALLDGDGAPPERVRTFLRFDLPVMLAMNALVAGAVLLLQLSEISAEVVRSAQIKYSLWGFAAGAAASAGLAAVSLAVSRYMALPPTPVFLVAYGLILAGAMVHGKLIPAVSLFLLLSLIAFVYF